jgi:tRNA pseudouridine55 synthase
MNGVLLVDKPAGLTSHDVVHRIRRILAQRSIGHLGTLDPMATGLLPLVAGNLTRLAQFYTASPKAYEGSIRFGFTTDTYDAEGEPTSEQQPIALDRDRVTAAAAKFQGKLSQMPPPFSAKKIHGVPAYKLARKKKDVPLSPVQVEIMAFDILDCSGDVAHFRAEVSSGTYMRSIAHDLGRELGCGAHLLSLRRTRSSEFQIADAHTLEQLEELAHRRAWDEIFLHPRTLLPQMPSVTATDEMASRIRSGRSVNLPDFSRARQVKVFYGQRDLIAIATRVAGTLFHPGIVFSSEAAATEKSVVIPTRL